MMSRKPITKKDNIIDKNVHQNSSNSSVNRKNELENSIDSHENRKKRLDKTLGSSIEESIDDLPQDTEHFTACIEDLPEDEGKIVEDLIQIRTFKKGSLIIKAGEVANCSYSILKGIVRQYYLIEGEEKTTFFFTEGQSIFGLQGESVSEPVKYYLSCVEETTLTILTRENEIEMFKRAPRFEALSRASLKEEIRDYQEMLATYITTSPEQRYANLLKNRPELLHRVPQYQLASYLGVKPESLSRIRKRISS